MSAETSNAGTRPHDRRAAPVRRGRPALGERQAKSLLARGESMIWCSGGALAICLVMIVGLLCLIFAAGAATFWPQPLLEITTVSAAKHLGEVARVQQYDLDFPRLEMLSGQEQTVARELLNRELQIDLEQQLAGGGFDEWLARSGANDPSVGAALRRLLEDALRADRSGTALAERCSRWRAAGQAAAAPEQAAGGTSTEAIPGGSAANVESLAAALVVSLVDERSRSVALPMRRRLLRTGNFELTNTHFHWISDLEIAEQGRAVKLPPWALVVERNEWGRCYGWPREFVLRREREVSAEERSLEAAVQFLEANQHRLSEADEQLRFQQTLAPLARSLQATRRESVAQFLASAEAGAADRLDAVVAGSPAAPVSSASADENVTAVAQVWTTPAGAWEQYQRYHGEVRARFRERRQLQREDIGEINSRVEKARLMVRQAELDHRAAILDVVNQLEQVGQELQALDRAASDAESQGIAIRALCRDNPDLVQFAERFLEPLRAENLQQRERPRQRLAELEGELAAAPLPVQDAVRRFQETTRQATRESLRVQEQIEQLERENRRYELRLVTSQDQETALELSGIVRAYPANQLGPLDKIALYAARWTEFLGDNPREANSEGGVFPAIWGTVVMTLIMSLVVVPFGVLAALYLREYARAGPIVSAVRISINNLAGVPSIVFGVFGLGFFCYVVGAYVDAGAANANLPVWPPARWFAAMAALATVGLAAFVFSLLSVTWRRGGALWRGRMGYAALAGWLAAFTLLLVVIATNPYFQGLFQVHLPNPRFGKGGLLWASLTLALLTLPVVIVATEEALAAVPNSLREGSYACGAGRWQTIRRIVLPHAMPGIMTGMILAMARGAGEVAPLMLVGAVKLAPELPVDASPPFLHLDRSFMHLGFHIFDLGFQSQNSEAAKPMVFTTTLLLITLIAVLNVSAIWLRSRLRRRSFTSDF